MKPRIVKNVFNDNMKLYIEHVWVEDYVCPAGRNYIVIAYIVYGRGTVTINKQKFNAEAKDIFVVNPSVGVEFISQDTAAENHNFEIYYIFFEKSFLRGTWEIYGQEFVELDSFFSNEGRAYIKVKDHEMFEIRNYIVRIINEYYADALARKSALLGHMLSPLPVIFRRYAINEDQIFSKNTLVDQTIRQIRNSIYQNPKPSEIAKHRFVTTDHLGRVFKQETGMTITQYINTLRVEMTKDILHNTDRPIELIPIIFNIKLKYLQQIFKQYTGMSMREYRLKHHYR